ncbi:MAG: CorA family divalent cation transporter [Eubacterium sp.]
MFYVFRDEVLSVELDDITADDLVLGYVKYGDIDKISNVFSLPSKCVDLCRNDSDFFHFDVEKTDACIFAKLKLINPSEIKVDSDSLAVFIKKNLFLIVDICDTDGSIRDKLLYTKNRFLPGEISISRIALAFLESTVLGDSKFIEHTQNEIERLEREVIENKTDKSFNLNLLSCKQTLLYMHNYYEQLLDIAQAFSDWHEDIFEESELQYFNSFCEKIKRLLDNINLLRDSVIQLRDAYNSALELTLNSSMKIFTVFTVFFSPLTLISGWYGMNFTSMKELDWRFGYLIPIVLSLSVVAILFAWFRHKKWI